MHTGERIHELIKQHGLTIDEVADKLHLSRGGVYKIIKTGNVYEKYVEKLAQLFKLTPQAVRYGKTAQHDLDAHLATIIIKAIDTHLESRKERLRPDKKAELFCYLYSKFSDNEKQPTESDLIDILHISSTMTPSL